MNYLQTKKPLLLHSILIKEETVDERVLDIHTQRIFLHHSWSVMKSKRSAPPHLSADHIQYIYKLNLKHRGIFNLLISPCLLKIKL